MGGLGGPPLGGLHAWGGLGRSSACLRPPSGLPTWAPLPTGSGYRASTREESLLTGPSCMHGAARIFRLAALHTQGGIFGVKLNANGPTTHAKRCDERGAASSEWVEDHVVRIGEKIDKLAHQGVGFRRRVVVSDASSSTVRFVVGEHTGAPPPFQADLP